MSITNVSKDLILYVLVEWRRETVEGKLMFIYFFRYRVMEHTELQITDYIFVIAMGCEITLKVLAEGLLFTPKALIKDLSGVLDLFIFAVSLIWLCWMPKNVTPNSLAQLLMLLR